MNRPIRPVRDAIYLTVMAATLTIGTLFFATAPAAEPYDFTRVAEPFEVMMHQSDVIGARDIESGDYAKGVKRLLTRLGSGKQSYSVRAPIFIDLCAGYTLLEDFDQATRYCDDAVEAGWYAGLALNNRGALKIAKGDYESAIDDFVAALRASGADAMARRNLQRTVAKMAAIRDARNATVAQVMDPRQ
jgi:tetratricopeptide (TPR) repeat protein